MRSFVNKALALLLIAALAAGGVGVAVAQSDERAPRLVRVGWIDVGVDESINAKLQGYQYEYLQALAQYTGWTYQNVTGTLDQCLEWLASGQLDMLGFIQKNEEREKKYAYPNLPMAVTSGILAALPQRGLNGSNAALEGAVIGMETVSANSASFMKYCAENALSVKSRSYSSYQELIAALDSGEVDAIVTGEEEKRADDQTLLKFSLSNQYFVTNLNDHELLLELNAAMEQLTTFYPYFNSDLYSKYFTPSRSGLPSFTSDEIAFIQTHPDVLVMYDSGWPPVEYFDEEAKTYKGISPDLFALLSKKCGINFVYEGSTSGQVLAQLQGDDNKNVLTTISYDYAWAEAHNVYITQPFISSSIIKLGRNLDAERPTVAINEKAYFTYALKDFLKNVNTVNYPKQAQRLEAVRTGAADYTVVTEDQADYYRSIPRYSGLQTQDLVGYEQKICISVSKQSDPELFSILSKSLASITHDEMNDIIRRNTVNVYKMTFGDYLYRYWVVIACALAVLLTLIVAAIWRGKVMREKQSALQKVNAVKSEFLAHVSHDIRTPLNAIIGISALAAKEDDSKLVHDYLGKINESSEYLLGLINDTLDMSKIENGKLKMHLEPVSFAQIYNVITAVITPRARDKGIKLVVQRHDDEDCYIMADKFRLEQIFLNLLNNAVKFTQENGTVTCDVHVLQRSGDSVTHRITVADTGVGISKDFMAKLYEPFEQEHNRLSIENAGTGLGLSIVKSIVDLMGGTISCTSQKNVGTTFVIDLTSRVATAKEIEELLQIDGEAQSVDLSGKRALLAEDNAMNILVAQKLLENKGMLVTVTKNGKDALDAFAASEPEYFDVILMDIHMPVMNGLDATRAIRTLDRDDAQTTPIIALSANAFAEDRVMSIEAGMNDHIAKPIDATALFDAIARCVLRTHKK